MPVKNAATYLPEALRSIACQHWRDYEVVVVDDGSTDHTAEIVRHQGANDARVRLFRRDAEGIVSALNFGLEQCRASLVARMDGDDVMHPARLACQYEAFQNSPDIALSATAVNLFPVQAVGVGMYEYINWQHGLTTPEALAANIFWEAPFVHPSVMFDRDVVLQAGGYADGPFPEDYELWLRLHARGARFMRLATPLLSWRQHPGSLSRTDSRYSQSGFDSVRVRYLCQHLRGRGVNTVVVWGAGRRTRKRARALLAENLDIVAWIDIDPLKVGKTLNGIPVHAPSWLCGRDAVVLAYVRAHGARALIANELEQMGLRAGHEYWPVG
jgi:cellulose synthase/poly-beta-1,6-N-acetylglucosamine synthase-like glycosyltransferase